MPSSSLKYWKFQGRALLTRLGAWNWLERWRLHWRFRRGIAHESDFRFFQHFDGSEQLFVDVGANLGQSALSFRLAHRTGSILSFEPNPDMEPALRVVKRLLGDPFTFHMHGLGARTEIKQMFVPMIKGVPFPQCATFHRECLENNVSMRQLIYEWTHTDRFAIDERPIQLVRFDELGLNPGFVKIDVEGSECEVITGMEETLARCRPLILTEGCGALAWLTLRGYQTFLHEPKRNCLLPASGSLGTSNVFFVPAEKVPVLARAGAVQGL